MGITVDPSLGHVVRETPVEVEHAFFAELHHCVHEEPVLLTNPTSNSVSVSTRVFDILFFTPKPRLQTMRASRTMAMDNPGTCAVASRGGILLQLGTQGGEGISPDFGPPTRGRGAGSHQGGAIARVRFQPLWTRKSRRGVPDLAWDDVSGGGWR